MEKMTNNNVLSIRWRVTDPQGRQVVLRQETYEKHILNDHDAKDALFRKEAEYNAKRSVTNPQFIMKDNREDNYRHLYYSVAVFGGDTQPMKVKLLKTVVDTDRTPNEIVTWSALKKGDKIEEGEKIYEQGDEVSNKEI